MKTNSWASKQQRTLTSCAHHTPKEMKSNIVISKCNLTASTWSAQAPSSNCMPLHPRLAPGLSPKLNLQHQHLASAPHITDPPERLTERCGMRGPNHVSGTSHLHGVIRTSYVHDNCQKVLQSATKPHRYHLRAAQPSADHIRRQLPTEQPQERCAVKA